MYAFTCSALHLKFPDLHGMAAWGVMNVYTEPPLIKDRFKRKEVWPPQSSNNIKKTQSYSLAAIFYPSFTFSPRLFFFFQSVFQKRSFISFDFQQRSQMRNSFSWPGTTHKKNLSVLLSHVDPPESGLCPTLGPQPGPALWHSLARTPPKAGCPQQMGRSSIQSFSAAAPDWMQTPFVIQPFNFFQMFPNKQRNKIKRERFFSQQKQMDQNFPSL